MPVFHPGMNAYFHKMNGEHFYSRQGKSSVRKGNLMSYPSYHESGVYLLLLEVHKFCGLRPRGKIVLSGQALGHLRCNSDGCVPQLGRSTQAGRRLSRLTARSAFLVDVFIICSLIKIRHTDLELRMLVNGKQNLQKMDCSPLEQHSFKEYSIFGSIGSNRHACHKPPS